MLIRPCSFNEIKGYASKAAREHVSLKQSDKTVWNVAEEGGRILGIAGLLSLANNGIRIKGVYVVPTVREKGIGTYLTEYLINEAIESGANRVEAYALKPDFYLKRGFKEAGRLPNGAVKVVKTFMNAYNGFKPALRFKALQWLKGEVAGGRRSNPVKCGCCGQTKGIIEAHSEDYSEPFGDNIGKYGLCYRCHMMIHCRFKHKGAWNVYRAQVLSGMQFEPMYARDFRRFVSDHLDNPSYSLKYIVLEQPIQLSLMAVLG